MADNSSDAVAQEQCALLMGCKRHTESVVREKVARPGSESELELEFRALNHNSRYKLHEVSEQCQGTPIYCSACKAPLLRWQLVGGPLGLFPFPIFPVYGCFSVTRST